MVASQQKGPLWTVLEKAFVNVLDAGYTLIEVEDEEAGLWQVLILRPMPIMEDGSDPVEVQFRILASDPDKAEAVRKALRAHNIPVPDDETPA